jgi:hypothetical protein
MDAFLTGRFSRISRDPDSLAHLEWSGRDQVAETEW